MTDRDRFRGQDPDGEFSHEEYSGQDETSSSRDRGGDDESAMQQDQGGRSPEAESEFTSGRGRYPGQDETSPNIGEGMQSRRPGEGGKHRRPDDEHATDEDEFGDEETGGGSNW